jgi:8-oxo-dGTP pyrophosphatase MutT (NUDIX family)
MLRKDQVLDLLRAYPDASMRNRFVAFVEAYPENFTDRHNPAGHLTAAGWVVNESHERALLVHHAKLDRWVQPGGHIDPEDDTPAAAAVREIREETGLSEFRLADEALYDLAIHEVAARGDMPAHRHYDMRFLFVAPDSGIASHADDPAEILELAWMSNAAIAEDTSFDPTVRALAAKSLARLR